MPPTPSPAHLDFRPSMLWWEKNRGNKDAALHTKILIVQHAGDEMQTPHRLHPLHTTTHINLDRNQARFGGVLNCCCYFPALFGFSHRPPPCSGTRWTRPARTRCRFAGAAASAAVAVAAVRPRHRRRCLLNRPRRGAEMP